MAAERERRKDHESLVRLLGSLDDLQDHYIGFTRRVLIGMAVLAVTNVVALGIGGVLIYRVANIARDARTDRSHNTRALCALRHDLEKRVADTKKFLVTHPAGFAGIPAATLRNTLNGQERTITALSVVVCLRK